MRVVIDLNKLSERERGYVCGFYVGDGNIFIYPKQWIYRVRFHTFIGEKHIQEKIVTLFRKLCNNIRIYETKDHTLIIEIHSKDLVTGIQGLVTKDGLYKENLSKNFLIGFIEGMIDSDGYVQRNYAEITTMNVRLKNNLVTTLKMLNIDCNIRTFASHLSKNKGYRVGFSLNDKLFYPCKWISQSGQTAE